MSAGDEPCPGPGTRALSVRSLSPSQPPSIRPHHMRFTFAFIAFLLCVPALTAQTLDPLEEAIVRQVDGQQAEAVAFLERIVNINSGTMNLPGVREVGRVFDAEFAAIGFETRWVSLPEEMNRAGHFFAERTGASGKRLLLIGHMDTIFETDSPFQLWVRRD